MIETCTHGNARNGLGNYSRVTIRTEWGRIVATIDVPARDGLAYLRARKRGRYFEQYQQAVRVARQLERDNNTSGQQPLLIA